MKYISKQKFEKLEELINIKEFFENSLESIANQKYEDLKEGINSIAPNIKYDRIKNKISKLIS